MRHAETPPPLEEYASDPQVLVEITSSCNFRCTYCSSPFRERPARFMEMPLFERIVAQLPELTRKNIRLHIDGEPTLHPRFREMVQLVNRRGMAVSLATNGSRLDPRDVDLRMDLRITVSPTPEDLARRQPTLDWEAYTRVVVGYVRAWAREPNEQALWIMVLLAHGRHDDEAYLAEVDGYIERFVAACELDDLARATPHGPHVKHVFHKAPRSSLRVVRTRTAGGGLYPVDGRFVEATPVETGFCDSPWKRLAILVDGRVSCCCLDLSGGTAFTAPEDIWSEDVAALWRDHPGIRAIRQAFLEERPPRDVCRRCLAHAPEGRREVGFSA